MVGRFELLRTDAYFVRGSTLDVVPDLAVPINRLCRTGTSTLTNVV
jgi:hypothetical protein